MLTPATSKLGRKYDVRPPSADHHLVRSAPRLRAPEAVPESVDWRPLLRPVRDQGQEGSCFAFATAALKEANCSFWGGGTAPLGGDLSPAYISWRTRLAEGSFPADSGASVADAMAVLQAWGVPPEGFLPYAQDPAQAGNAACDVAAQPYRVATPCAVEVSEAGFKAVLAHRHVICVGFEVFESFERTGLDGVVPDVQPGEGSLGGHAVLVVGYGPSGFTVRNSWGSGWGAGGYCFWPASYLAHVFDAWTTL